MTKALELSDHTRFGALKSYGKEILTKHFPKTNHKDISKHVPIAEVALRQKRRAKQIALHSKLGSKNRNIARLGIAGAVGTGAMFITRNRSKGKEVKASQYDLLCAKLDLMLGHEPLELESTTRQKIGTAAKVAGGAALAAYGIGGYAHHAPRMVKHASAFGKRASRSINSGKKLTPYVRKRLVKHFMRADHSGANLTIHGGIGVLGAHIAGKALRGKPEVKASLELAASPYEFGNHIAQKVGRQAANTRRARLGAQATMQGQMKYSSPMLRNTNKMIGAGKTAFGRGIKQLGGKGKTGLAIAGVAAGGMVAHKLAKRVYGKPQIKASQELQLGLFAPSQPKKAGLGRYALHGAMAGVTGIAATRMHNKGLKNGMKANSKGIKKFIHYTAAAAGDAHGGGGLGGILALRQIRKNNAKGMYQKPIAASQPKNKYTIAFQPHHLAAMSLSNPKQTLTEYLNNCLILDASSRN